MRRSQRLLRVAVPLSRFAVLMRRGSASYVRPLDHTMTFHQPFQMRLPAWADWLGLAFMSLAAPWIASYIHSWCVFHYTYRFYNADIGGIYFHGDMPPYPPPSMRWWGIFLIGIGGCGVPAIFTFLGLLPFRKRASYRWIVWAGFIILWTWLFFKMDIAI